MTSLSKKLLAVGVCVAAVTALVGATTYRSVAIHLAPGKHETTHRTPAAIAADSTFWRTFHDARYDAIQPAIEELTRAYLASPDDPVTASHIAWMHLWRIAERTRNDSSPATITEDMLIARRYFEEAVRLHPDDPRTLGFLASTRMGEGAIEHDERLVRNGYFTMKDAVKEWPGFNLFTAGYVASTLPATSPEFREGLEQQWLDLDACAGGRVDRLHPDFTNLLTRVKDRRACLNTWIAPHNGEGFFLNMGDMLVKAGQWRTAQQVYANAKLLPEYPTWKFAGVLDERIRDAEKNVARFNSADRDARTGLMNGSAFSCMACHEQ
jgi:hypothetical protein